MKENNSLISKIVDASEIHKKTYLSGLSRFTYLPNWLLFEAKIHEKECSSQIRNKYPYFKRGTIVMVDFGINIDSEFSGKHFAIILNKKDNFNNPVLTVLPLTSKEGRNRFSIGKELFDQTLQLLTKTEATLQIQASEKSEKISTLDKNRALANIVIKIYAKYNKESFVRISDIKTVSKLRINKINKYDPSGKIKLSKDTMNSISTELINLYASK